jgi:hypothetical protein
MKALTSGLYLRGAFELFHSCGEFQQKIRPFVDDRMLIYNIK